MAIRSDEITSIIKSAIDDFDSGVETRMMCSHTRPYSSSARSAQASVIPPITLGVLRSV